MCNLHFSVHVVIFASLPVKQKTGFHLKSQLMSHRDRRRGCVNESDSQRGWTDRRVGTVNKEAVGFSETQAGRHARARPRTPARSSLISWVQGTALAAGLCRLSPRPSWSRLPDGARLRDSPPPCTWLSLRCLGPFPGVPATHPNFTWLFLSGTRLQGDGAHERKESMASGSDGLDPGSSALRSCAAFTRRAEPLLSSAFSPAKGGLNLRSGPV